MPTLIGPGRVGRVGHALSQGVPPYLGQVATRTLVPSSTATANKQFSTRRYMFARDDITSLQIVVPNWYVKTSVNGAETAQGGTLTVKAAIEYPEGTYTQVLFGGSASGSVSDGATIVSDAVVVTIPRGAKFFLRMYAVFANGVLFANGSNCVDTANGDFSRYAASGLADVTMGGTSPSTVDTANTFTAAAVIAMTRRPSVYLLGDSLCAGTGDSVSDTTGDNGILARSVGPYAAYINGGCPSDRGYWAAANFTNRAVLAGYCSHVICELGTNDFYAGSRTSSQVKTSIESLRSLVGSSKPFFVTSITPRTTSTDSWATTANQTVATGNTNRVTYNGLVRAGSIVGASGYFEIADVVESARDSGKWAVNGAANWYTADGTHGNNTAYQAVRDSGGINMALFRRGSYAAAA